MAPIASIRALEILDSRGTPTVEVEVRPEDGGVGPRGRPGRLSPEEAMIVPRDEPLTVRMGSSPALQLSHLVLDFNGTLARDGELLPGVHRRLVRLARRIQVHVLTADTFGSARVALRDLPLSVHIVETGSEKRLFVTARRRVVAVGNGQNDIPMMRSASLGIAVLGPEGLCTELLRVADVLVASITDALDLLLEPRRLTATLRP